MEVTEQMEMKEVYEKLEQMEGGAELITAIKSEVSKLNSEAKTNRENGDKSAAKVKSIVDIQLPVIQAVAASGLLGKGAYYQLFPDELTEEAQEAVAKEKN